MIYRLTKRAKADIQSIDRHTVREFGFLQADLYIGGLDSLLELLCEYPEMGKTIHGDRRSFPYRRHIILYRVLSEAPEHEPEHWV